MIVPQARKQYVLRLGDEKRCIRSASSQRCWEAAEGEARLEKQTSIRHRTPQSETAICLLSLDLFILFELHGFFLSSISKCVRNESSTNLGSVSATAEFLLVQKPLFFPCLLARLHLQLILSQCIERVLPLPFQLAVDEMRTRHNYMCYW